MDKGKAYAFFSCSSSEETVNEGIKGILGFRDYYGIEKNIDFLLKETKKIHGDSGLAEIVKKARKYEMNYVIEAEYQDAESGKTAKQLNREASDQLAIMMIQIYNLKMFKEDEAYNKLIAYKLDTAYIERR